jgi:hypothetical protein
MTASSGNGSDARKSGSNGVVFPTFDPNPSGKFAFDVLKAVHVNGILIGRLAVWHWIPDPSEHAYTKDLDIAVAREALPRLRTWLNDHAHKTHELPIGGVNVAAENGAINVDFIDRAGELGDLAPLFEDAIRAAQESGRTVEIGGEILPVVTAEHLVAMKIATFERKDEEDAERLLENAPVDVDKLRNLVSKFLGPIGPARLENVLRTVGHPAARPRRKYNREGSGPSKYKPTGTK